MSRETYIAGFCKTASANGVDPKELVRFLMYKCAEGEQTNNANPQGGFMDSIGKWWNEREPWQKGLMTMGGGALAGSILQRLLFGGKSGLAGALLGGLGGLAYSGIDWDALMKTFNNGNGKGGRTQNQQTIDSSTPNPMPPPEQTPGHALGNGQPVSDNG